MDPITIAAAITATKTLVNRKPGSSIGEKNKSILQKRAKDDGSETSMSSAAAAVIEEKQLKQQLDDLKAEINSKWPSKPGEKTTWELILDERKKRIADKKERERLEKIKAEERAERRKVILIEIAKGLAVVIIAGSIGWFLWWAATSGPAVT